MTAGKFKGPVKWRMQRLLNMMYRPSELAEELGIDVRQFRRVYIPLGCPHRKADNGQIYINGAEFREWYKLQYAKVRLGEGEGYCLTCKKPVALKSVVIKESKGLKFWQGACAICGRQIARIITSEPKGHDSS